MSDDATTAGFGPLPEPFAVNKLWGHSFNVYTALQLRAYAETAIDYEKKRVAQFLLAKHEAARGAHNYYLCAAVELGVVNDQHDKRGIHPPSR